MAGQSETAIRVLPPRYWWLKRLALAYIGILLLAVIVRVWWNYSVNRRLDALVAGYRAAGEPVLAEDFQVAPIPNGENAAQYILQATAAIRISKDDQHVFDNTRLNSATPEQFMTIARIMNDNQTTFDLIHQARQFDKADWGIKWTTPAINILLPHLNSMRNLADLLAAKATLAHMNGNDAGAVEVLMDMNHLGKSLEDSPAIVSHLVRIGIDAKTNATIEGIVPSLKIGSDNGANSKPASREQVRQLIDALLDESSQQRGLSKGMANERYFQLDMTRSVAKGDMSIGWAPSPVSPPYAAARLMAPMYFEDAIEMMEASTRYVRATTQPDLPSIGTLPTPPKTDSAQGYIVHVVSRFLFPSLNRVYVTHFRVIQDRRRHAVDLAARLYESDHGKPPHKIEDLVPDYLPAVPLDPIAGNGTRMVYPSNPTTAPSAQTR